MSGNKQNFENKCDLSNVHLAYPIGKPWVWFWSAYFLLPSLAQTSWVCYIITKGYKNHTTSPPPPIKASKQFLKTINQPSHKKSLNVIFLKFNQNKIDGKAEKCKFPHLLYFSPITKYLILGCNYFVRFCLLRVDFRYL